jgi:hypothetical protein
MCAALTFSGCIRRPRLWAESKEAHVELGEVAGPKSGVQPLVPPHDPATFMMLHFFPFQQQEQSVLVQILLKGFFPSAVHICGGR